jgi:nucleotide-binding universal stress UspA family protein
VKRAIVAGYNATDACRRSVRRASSIAARTGATVHVVSAAVPPVPVGGFGWSAPYETSQDLGKLVHERADEGAALVPDGIAAEAHAAFGNPGREIVAVAEKVNAGLIVVGRVVHSTLDRILLGSTADKVVRLAPVPVLMAAAEDCAQRVLVALDDSPAGEAALRAAVRLAADTGAEVACVHVVEAPPPGLTPGEAADMDGWANELAGHFMRHVEEIARGVAPDAAAPATKVRIGEPAAAVLDEAKEFQADLIAVGTHGRGFLQRAILGSVSESILRQSPVSVLVVPK